MVRMNSSSSTTEPPNEKSCEAAHREQMSHAVCDGSIILSYDIPGKCLRCARRNTVHTHQLRTSRDRVLHSLLRPTALNVQICNGNPRVANNAFLHMASKARDRWIILAKWYPAQTNPPSKKLQLYGGPSVTLPASSRTPAQSCPPNSLSFPS